MKKQLLSFSLLFALLFGLFPCAALGAVPEVAVPEDSVSGGSVPAVSNSQIESRIDSLCQIFAGSYFNVGRDTGCGTVKTGHGCKHCLGSNIVETAWFKELFGEVSTDQYPSFNGFYPNGMSCYGFAVFAEWYIFKQENSDSVSVNNTGRYDCTVDNLRQYAKLGDILWLNGRHAAIFLAVSADDKVIVLDCNGQGDYACQVNVRYLDMSGFYSRVSIYTADVVRTDIAASGECGENLRWELDGAGVLTISGQGDMPSFTLDHSPWHDCAVPVQRVVIEKGVTSIGRCAFSGCGSLTSASIPVSVTSIGEHAFHGCASLKSLNIPDSVTSIGSFAFTGCGNLSDVFYSGAKQDWNLMDMGAGNSPLMDARLHFDVSSLTKTRLERFESMAAGNGFSRC